MVFTKLQL